MARNLFEYHPVLGYRFIPGLIARVSHEAGGYLVRCNQAGFRCDHEVTLITCLADFGQSGGPAEPAHDPSLSPQALPRNGEGRPWTSRMDVWLAGHHT